MGFSPVDSKTIIFTGGLNEITNSLELRPGELIECQNFFEIGGSAHGYSTPKGFERYDGRTSPSSVTVNTLYDYGRYTGDSTYWPYITDPNLPKQIVLLKTWKYPLPLWTASGMWRDLGLWGTQSLANNWSGTDAEIDYSVYKFDDFSFKITGTGTGNDLQTELDDLYTIADVLVQSSFTIDIWVNTQNQASFTIGSKQDTFSVSIDANKKVVYTWYNSSTPYTLTSTTAIADSNWNHIRLSCKHKATDDQTLYLFINGVLDISSDITTPINTLEYFPVVIGGTSGKTFYIDSFRLTDDHLSVTDFIVPASSYMYEYFLDINYDDEDREDTRALIQTAINAVPVGATGANYIGRSINHINNFQTRSTPAAYLFSCSYHHISASDHGISLLRSSASGWVTRPLEGKTTWVNTSDSDMEDLVDRVLFTQGVFSDFNPTKTVLFASVPFESASGEYSKIYYTANNAALSDWQSLELETDPGTSSTIGGSTPSAGYPYEKDITYMTCLENRLWLCSHNELYISDIGTALGWSPTYDNSTVIKFNSDVLGIEHLSDGVVVVFLRQGIDIIKGIVTTQHLLDGGSGWGWEKSTITNSVNIIANSIAKSTKDIYFISRQGALSLNKLSASETFENFAISDNVSQTLQDGIDNSLIIGATINREFGQYRIYFSDGRVICITVNEDSSVKGCGLIVTSLPIKFVHSSVYDQCFCSGTDGYMYRFDHGTSFDGADIDSYFISAFYNYGTNRQWKQIQSVVYEIESGLYVPMTNSLLFSYSRADLPVESGVTKFANIGGNVWATLHTTDTSSWTPTGLNMDNPICYNYGVGNNMALKIQVSSKYADPTTIYNATVNYTVNGRMV